MFSKYKKSGASATSARPEAAPRAETARSAPPKPTGTAVQRRQEPPKNAQVNMSDKDRKRKERLGEIKIELHRELLERAASGQ